MDHLFSAASGQAVPKGARPRHESFRQDKTNLLSHAKPAVTARSAAECRVSLSLAPSHDCNLPNPPIGSAASPTRQNADPDCRFGRGHNQTRPPWQWSDWRVSRYKRWGFGSAHSAGFLAVTYHIPLRIRTREGSLGRVDFEMRFADDSGSSSEGTLGRHPDVLPPTTRQWLSAHSEQPRGLTSNERKQRSGNAGPAGGRSGRWSGRSLGAMRFET